VSPLAGTVLVDCLVWGGGSLAAGLVGFAIGNATDGNIWALFVDPEHERRGYGRRLHDTMTQWLRSRGLGQLWLTTEPGTRAQKFYESAGWRFAGTTPRGEARYELGEEV